jgi:hypothetical protein
MEEVSFHFNSKKEKPLESTFFNSLYIEKIGISRDLFDSIPPVTKMMHFVGHLEMKRPNGIHLR